MVVSLLAALLVFSLDSSQCLAEYSSNSKWLLDYTSKGGIRSDGRFRDLCKKIVPKNWVGDIFECLTGGGDKVGLLDNRYLTFASFKNQSAQERVYFWYDLTDDKGILVLCYSTGKPGPAYFLTKDYGKSEIPQEFWDMFNLWAAQNEIVPEEKEFPQETQSPRNEAKTLDSTKIRSVHRVSFDFYKKGDANAAADALFKEIGENDSLSDYVDIGILNDLGFFLSEADRYEEAAIVLRKVIRRAPSRTVAHLNLADAYWGLQQNEKACASYQTYVSLMRKDGKEKKIPSRAIERCPDAKK
jgi:tetratricopeptide (TPR) repeat protein